MSDVETEVMNRQDTVSETKPKRRTVGKKRTAGTKATPKRRALAKKVVVTEDDTAKESDTPQSIKPKRAATKRKPRVRRDYMNCYGDLETPEKERDYSKEAFEAWKVGVQKRVSETTFTEWRRDKHAFYRQVAALSKRKKKTRKQDPTRTSANHLDRLKEMDADAFEVLDGVYLSQYGFDGAFTAEELEAGCPNDGALSAYVVFQAARHAGYNPLGIVSEKGKHDEEGNLQYLTTVDGDRVYVGIALPFRNKEKSPFCAIPQDRVFQETEEPASVAKTPSKRTTGPVTEDEGNDEDEEDVEE